jgi:hypothetical protein
VWHDCPRRTRGAVGSENLKLSAIRKLALEGSYAGLLDATTASAIRDVKGAKVQARGTGSPGGKPSA